MNDKHILVNQKISEGWRWVEVPNKDGVIRRVLTPPDTDPRINFTRSWEVYLEALDGCIVYYIPSLTFDQQNGEYL